MIITGDESLCEFRRGIKFHRKSKVTEITKQEGLGASSWIQKHLHECFVFEETQICILRDSETGSHSKEGAELGCKPSFCCSWPPHPEGASWPSECPSPTLHFPFSRLLPQGLTCLGPGLRTFWPFSCNCPALDVPTAVSAHPSGLTPNSASSQRPSLSRGSTDPLPHNSFLGLPIIDDHRG